MTFTTVACCTDSCLCTTSGFTPAGTRLTGRSRLTGRCARRRRGPTLTFCRQRGTAWRSGGTPSQVRPAAVKKTVASMVGITVNRLDTAPWRGPVPGQGWRSGQKGVIGTMGRDCHMQRGDGFSKAVPVGRHCRGSGSSATWRDCHRCSREKLSQVGLVARPTSADAVAAAAAAGSRKQKVACHQGLLLPPAVHTLVLQPVQRGLCWLLQRGLPCCLQPVGPGRAA